MTSSAQTAAPLPARAGSNSRVVTTPRPRPDLPSWFSGTTTSLYAVGAGLVVAFLMAAATVWAVPGAETVIGAVTAVLMHIDLALVVGVGTWCFVAAGSRRVDPTTPQLDREWLLISWFLPVAHILVPHRMFGDLWASARWQQSDKRGANSPLAPRPWVISAWAWGCGADFMWFLTGFLREVDATFLAVHLALSAVSAAFLVAVVRVIALELEAPRG